MDSGGYEKSPRGQLAVVVTAVLTAISVVIVAMRIYTRVWLIKLSGREDWTILVSQLFAIVYLALVGAQYHFGLGRHSDELPEHILEEQLKRLWVAIPMYNASLAFTKFSLLFQYLRIFPSRRFRLICYSVMAVVVLYSSWAVISGFVNCVPVAKFWNSQIPGVCLSFQAVWFFNAAMNIATDVALLILPMPLVSHLHLPRMQKLLLVGVFALGTLVVITSCLRLSSLHSVAESKDTSWANVGAAYWTAAECNVSIICASLPFLRPLISHIFPRFLSTHSNSKTGNRTRTTAVHSTFRRASTFPFTQDPEFGLVTIDTEAQGGGPHSTTTKGLHNSGIEVTMEMIQEVAPSMRPQSMPHNMNAASTSQRRLLLDAQ